MPTWPRIATYLGLLRLIPQLPDTVRLCWRLWRDRRVPVYLKGMLSAALLYIVSPLDLMPEMLLPVVGYVDDVTLLLLAGYYFMRWSPPEIVAEHVAAIASRHRSRPEAF
jgi:uncharacterized membrane protein YkvA (DUF1232 family)